MVDVNRLIAESIATQRALIAVVLAVGGKVEIDDYLLASIDLNMDLLNIEQSETKQSHIITVERQGKLDA